MGPEDLLKSEEAGSDVWCQARVTHATRSGRGCTAFVFTTSCNACFLRSTCSLYPSQSARARSKLETNWKHELRANLSYCGRNSSSRCASVTGMKLTAVREQHVIVCSRMHERQHRLVGHGYIKYPLVYVNIGW